MKREGFHIPSFLTNDRPGLGGNGFAQPGEQKPMYNAPSQPSGWRWKNAGFWPKTVSPFDDPETIEKKKMAEAMAQVLEESISEPSTEKQAVMLPKDGVFGVNRESPEGSLMVRVFLNALFGVKEACKVLAGILVLWGLISIPATNALGWQFTLAGVFWIPFVSLDILLRLWPVKVKGKDDEP